MQLKTKLLLSMVTYGNIVTTLVGGVQNPRAAAGDAREFTWINYPYFVIERRWKRTHMVRNRIPVCHVAIYLRYVACLTSITYEND